MYDIMTLGCFLFEIEHSQTNTYIHRYIHTLTQPKTISSADWGRWGR